jgi:hypothetical protein
VKYFKKFSLVAILVTLASCVSTQPSELILQHTKNCQTSYQYQYGVGTMEQTVCQEIKITGDRNANQGIQVPGVPGDNGEDIEEPGAKPDSVWADAGVW